MLRKLRPRLTYANVVSTLCLFLVVAGGTAYAANTVFSTDIVDGEVKTADLASPAVTNNKLAANSVTTGKVVNESLGALDLGAGSVGTSEVTDNSLTGADVAESSLVGVMPTRSTAAISAAQTAPSTSVLPLNSSRFAPAARCP